MLAQTAWEDFCRQARHSVVLHHCTWLIEMTYRHEKITELPEAPHGTLIHHDQIVSDGLMTYAHLIIATRHDHLPVNRVVLQAAQHFESSDDLREKMLNCVEAVIRAFDPCLSCSPHACGDTALRIVLQDVGGHIIDEETW